MWPRTIKAIPPVKSSAVPHSSSDGLVPGSHTTHWACSLLDPLPRAGLLGGGKWESCRRLEFALPRVPACWFANYLVILLPGKGNLSYWKCRILQQFWSSISKASSPSQLTTFLCQAGRKRALLNHPGVNEGHCHPVTRWLITASAARAASKKVDIIHDAYTAMYLKGNLYSHHS